MSTRLLMTAAVLALLAPAAWADTTRLRGTVTSLDGTTLHVTPTGGGADQAVSLGSNPTVTALVPATLADITAGRFIGTAADTQPDGTLVAREVHIFPDSMRGMGEGHRAFDLGPKSTMTNGTVGQEVKATTGDRITVAYKGGEKSIVVPPSAPVVLFEPGDATLLIPGAHVIVQAQTGPGGTLSADRVTVGRNGLVPPM